MKCTNLLHGLIGHKNAVPDALPPHRLDTDVSAIPHSPNANISGQGRSRRMARNNAAVRRYASSLLLK
jgi:hypothetical protein